MENVMENHGIFCNVKSTNPNQWKNIATINKYFSRYGAFNWQCLNLWWDWYKLSDGNGVSLTAWSWMFGLG